MDNPSDHSDPVDVGADVVQRLHGRLGRDALRYLPAVVVPALLSVASVAIFTRVFPPGPYGFYTLVIATATILVAITGGWLQQSVLRYLPRYQSEGAEDTFLGRLNVILWGSVAALIVVSVPVYFALGGALDGYAHFYVPAVALVGAWLLFGTYNTVFQAGLRSSRYARYQLAFAVLRLSISLAFVFFVARDVLGLVVGTAAAYAVLVIPMMKDLGLFRVGRRASRVNSAFAKQIAFYGVPVIGWAIGNKVLDISDRYIIAMFRGPAEVGIYAANYNLVTMVVAFIAAPLLLAADPLIVNAYERGAKDRAGEIISAFSRYFLIAAVPAATFLAVFSKHIAALVFGAEFRSGHTIIPLIVTGLVIWNFSMYGQKGLNLVEKTKLIFLLVVVCAAANMALNFVFVPTYGYMGAAVATLLSFALYPLMMYWVSKRELPWQIPYRSVVRVLLAAAVSAGGCLILERALAPWGAPALFLAIGAVVLVVLYVATLVLLREPKDFEVKFILRKIGIRLEESQ